MDKHSEMPMKSYYRVVLEPEPTFGASGEMSPGPQARFASLPEQPIFTMHYHIPDNWLIEPVKSVYDLVRDDHRFIVVIDSFCMTKISS